MINSNDNDAAVAAAAVAAAVLILVQGLSVFKALKVVLFSIVIIYTMNVYQLAMTKNNGHTNENLYDFDYPSNSPSSTSKGITNSHRHSRDDSRIIFDESSSNQLHQDTGSNNNNNTTVAALMEYRVQRRSHSYFDEVDSDSNSSSSTNDNNTEYVEFTRYKKGSNEKIETWKAKKRSFNECVTEELQKWKKEYEHPMDNNTSTSTNATTILSTSTFGVSQSQQPTPLYIGWRQHKGALDPIALMLEAEDMRRNSRRRDQDRNNNKNGNSKKKKGGRGRNGRCLKQYFNYYSKLQKPFSGEYDFFNWLDYGSGRSIQLNIENDNKHHKRKRLQKLKEMSNSTNITDPGMNSYCTRASLDTRTIRLLTKEETASYETYLIPYNSEIVTNDNNDNDHHNNSVNSNSVQEQQEQQQKSSSNSGNNNNNKIQVINSRTGKPLKKGTYLFVLTMDVVDDDDDPQQQQQQKKKKKKKSQSKLLLFPDFLDGKKMKHISPYPGAVPVWHAGEFLIQDDNDNDNGDGTTTTATTTSSSTTPRPNSRRTSRDTTNMHNTYISEITAGSGHYLPTHNHILWFQHWMKTSPSNTMSRSSSSNSIKKHHHQLKQQKQELNIESIQWTERNFTV